MLLAPYSSGKPFQRSSTTSPGSPRPTFSPLLLGEASATAQAPNAGTSYVYFQPPTPRASNCNSATPASSRSQIISAFQPPTSRGSHCNAAGLVNITTDPTNFQPPTSRGSHCNFAATLCRSRINVVFQPRLLGKANATLMLLADWLSTYFFQPPTLRGSHCNRVVLASQRQPLLLSAPYSSGKPLQLPVAATMLAIGCTFSPLLLGEAISADVI
jgi:hypothetical protein